MQPITKHIDGLTPASVTVLYVKRLDTNTTIDTDVSMTFTSPDIWSYVDNAQSGDFSYEYQIQINWPNGSFTQLDPETYIGTGSGTSSGHTASVVFTTTLATAGAVGFYATEDDMRDYFGNSIDSWSDVDATGSADEGRIQRALDYSDAYIDSFFAGGPFTLTPHLTFLDTASTTLVKQWAAKLAGTYLYRASGQRDEADAKPTNQYSAMLADVMREMGMYKAGLRTLNATRVASLPTAPMNVL